MNRSKIAVLFLTRARPRPAPRKPIPRVGATVCESLDKNAASRASSEGPGAGARSIAEAHVLRAGEALGDWLITRMSDEEVGVARGVIR